MISHPIFGAIVKNAGTALMLGWDPMVYAGVDGVNRLFAEAVLREGMEQYTKTEEAKANLLASKIASIIAKMF